MWQVSNFQVTNLNSNITQFRPSESRPLPYPTERNGSTSFICTICTSVQIYTEDVNLHLGVFWSCKRCFMKMHPGAKCIRVRICSTFLGGANLVEQISTRCTFAPGCKLRT